MAGAKDVRSLCQRIRPVRLLDGTLCRCESPLPGSVDGKPSWKQNFRLSGIKDSTVPLREEGWFEYRYPNLLEDARLRFAEVINTWVQKNWGATPFADQKQRIVVIGRNIYENPNNAKIIKDKGFVPDNRFEECGRVTADGIPLVGDTAQSQLEADQDLGRFWIDIETPFQITYSTKKVQGQPVRTFKWSAVMYVGDVLGAQEGDPVNWVNRVPLIGPMAPSRTVKRARWTIQGQGVSDADLAAPAVDQPTPMKTHTIAPGDTLSKLAEKYYGDAKWYPILYAANQQTIGNDPNMLRVGDTLRIPDLDALSQEQKDRAMKSVSQRNDHSITIAPLR